MTTNTGFCRATVIGLTREHRCPGRCATGRSGVEPVHPESASCHVVEVRGLHDGVTVVAGLRPPHVIGHEQNDVGSGIGKDGTCQHQGRQAKDRLRPV